MPFGSGPKQSEGQLQQLRHHGEDGRAEGERAVAVQHRDLKTR